MTSAPQYVTLVTQGGTPVRLTNQLGAPYPTTGRGAIVFAEGPVIHNPTIIGRIISVSGQAIGVEPGTETAPAIYFGDIESDDGFYSSGLHHVCITINGAQVADFSAAGLGVTGNITYTGTLSGPHAAFTGNVTAPTVPYPDNDTNVATTAYVTAALTAGLTGAYLPLSGGTVSGQFYVGSGIHMNPTTASMVLAGDIFAGEMVGDWKGVYLEAAGYVGVYSDAADYPGVILNKTNNPADQKQFAFVMGDTTTSGAFLLQALSDAWAVQREWVFARNGITRFPNHIFTENALGGVQLDPGGWIYVYSNNSDYAGMDFTRSDRPANDRLWVLNQGVSGDFRIAASDDAYGALKSWIFQRDGSTTLPGALTGTAATFTDTTVVWSSLVATAPTWPGISWTSTAAPVNAKNWGMTVDAGAADNTSLRLQVNDDSWTLLREWLFKRDGSTTLPGALTGTSATFSGNVTAPNIVKITVGPTAPSSPSVNDIWIDTN